MIVAKITFRTFCIFFVIFAQHEPLKARIFHPESFCPPKPATRKVLALYANVLPKA